MTCVTRSQRTSVWHSSTIATIMKKAWSTTASSELHKSNYILRARGRDPLKTTLIVQLKSSTFITPQFHTQLRLVIVIHFHTIRRYDNWRTSASCASTGDDVNQVSHKTALATSRGDREYRNYVAASRRVEPRRRDAAQLWAWFRLKSVVKWSVNRLTNRLVRQLIN